MDSLITATIILGPGTWMVGAILLSASGLLGLIALGRKSQDTQPEREEPGHAEAPRPRGRTAWQIAWAVLKIVFGVLGFIASIVAAVYAEDIRAMFPWPL